MLAQSCPLCAEDYLPKCTKIICMTTDLFLRVQKPITETYSANFHASMCGDRVAHRCTCVGHSERAHSLVQCDFS